jgi:hypothetical protein
MLRQIELWIIAAAIVRERYPHMVARKQNYRAAELQSSKFRQRRSAAPATPARSEAGPRGGMQGRCRLAQKNIFRMN